MSDKQLFRSLTEQEQGNLEEEAARRWDPVSVHASNARWTKYSPAKKQHILDQGNAIYAGMIAVMSESPSSPNVQAIVRRWHGHLQYFWSPDDEQLLGLADLYIEDARFHASFEAMQPGLAEFMRDAIREYVKNRS